MRQLNLISAGAAQSVVLQIAEAMRSESDAEVKATFGAVGAQKARLLAGEACDVVILTRAMIDELTAQSEVVAPSVADLGGVGLGVAVRAKTAWPDVSTAHKLRANMLAARGIWFPDPSLATAGIHLMKVMQQLGIRETLRERLHAFPNGNTAMTQLAQSTGRLQLGITMISEIKMVQGVELAGPLPAALQSTTIYSVAVTARVAEPQIAAEFVERLTGPRAKPMLTAAGFSL
jgi:molybdate transport system substrate-binding protein